MQHSGSGVLLLGLKVGKVSMLVNTHMSMKKLREDIQKKEAQESSVTEERQLSWWGTEMGVALVSEVI